MDGGPTFVGVESTVIDMTVEPPQILRPGGTPYESLVEVIGDVRLHPSAIAKKEVDVVKPKSPGMKYRHYAPRAGLILVEGEVDAIVRRVREIASAKLEEGLRVGILATDETLNSYDGGVYVVRSLGSRRNLSTIAKNLFKVLRELDDAGVDLIIAEGVPQKGLGLAVMNRLRKASSFNIVKA